MPPKKPERKPRKTKAPLAKKGSPVAPQRAPAAGRKRVSKNSDGMPLAVTCEFDPLVARIDDDEERRLAELVYGVAECGFDDAPCFRVMMQEEMISIMTSENPDVVEGGLECRRCKSRKILSRSMQIRGGDEGTTVFASCSECKYSWREG